MVRLVKPILEIDCSVVGYAHADAPKVIDKLKAGQSVTLVDFRGD